MWISCVQVPADEVCGCPLVRDVFEPTGEYCRVSKRKCNKHYCWEKLRRAEVDLERVRVVSALPPLQRNHLFEAYSKDISEQLMLLLHKIALLFINLTFNLSFIYWFSLSRLFPPVVQVGWIVWAGAQCKNSHDESCRSHGPHAAPDDSTRPNYHRSENQQGQIRLLSFPFISFAHDVQPWSNPPDNLRFCLWSYRENEQLLLKSPRICEDLSQCLGSCLLKLINVRHSCFCIVFALMALLFEWCYDNTELLCLHFLDF